jgi:hypothetical protein
VATLSSTEGDHTVTLFLKKFQKNSYIINYSLHLKKLSTCFVKIFLYGGKSSLKSNLCFKLFVNDFKKKCVFVTEKCFQRHYQT